MLLLRWENLTPTSVEKEYPWHLKPRTLAWLFSEEEQFTNRLQVGHLPTLGLTLLQEKQVSSCLKQQLQQTWATQGSRNREWKICTTLQWKLEGNRSQSSLSNGCDLQCQHGFRQLLMLEVNWCLSKEPESTEMEAVVMEEEWGTWSIEVGNTVSFAK